MKVYTALAALAALVAAAAVAAPATGARNWHTRGEGDAQPQLVATSPSSGIVDLTWSGITSDRVVLWQCFGQTRHCYDTFRDNTGTFEVEVATGWHAYQVCDPTTNPNTCTNVAAINIR